MEAYRKRYGTTPDIYAAQGYDAAYLLAEAIRRADDVSNGKVIRDKLAAILISKACWEGSAGRRIAMPPFSPKVLIGDSNGKVFVAAPS